ncbi:XdhC family protein [Streptomyces sp. NPDC057253]|uniref:XdhC family protein n=1 Tax=Streptomyces sp. NPDC057253 TaxID=3346069 RepID=UPI003641DA45
MLNIADTLDHWCRTHRSFAVATVVQVSGSAPLPPGTSLAVDADGEAVGSISGGCVEAAVYDMCREVLDTHSAPVRVRFGYSDSDAFAVGLTCGGVLDVLVQRVVAADMPHLAAAFEHAARGRPVAVAQVVDGPAAFLGGTLHVRPGTDGCAGTLGREQEDRAVTERARALLRAGQSALVEIGGDTDTCPQRLSVLVHTNATRPRMLIFGAVDFAGALSEAGRFLGYHVTVCDARPVFATRARFPHADEVVIEWPHRYLENTAVDSRTAVCVLTHDAKFDVPLLALALGLPVGYVGAMGSRRTHEHRETLLREAGVAESALARLRSPIGLDLGARTPAETALSIVAEIVADTNRGTGVPLSSLTGPIHRALTDPASLNAVAAA